MKKPVAIAAILVILIIAFTLVLPCSLPVLTDAENHVALKDDGTVCLVQNSTYSSYLYQLNGKSVVTGVYREKSTGVNRSYISQAAWGKDCLFFIRMTADSGDLLFHNWELVRLDGSLKNPVTICKGNASNLPAENGLSVDGNTVYLTSISASGSLATVYSVDASAQQPALTSVVNAMAPKNKAITDAAYASGSAYCLMNDGTAVRYASVGGSSELQSGSSVTALSADGSCLWMYNRDGGSVSCISGVAEGDSISADSFRILAGEATGDSNMAMLGVSKWNQTVLIRSDGSGFTSSGTIIIPFVFTLVFKLDLIKAVGISACCLAIVFVLILFVVRKSRRVAVKVTAVSAVVMLSLLCVFFAGAIANGLSSFQGSMQAQANLCATETARTLSAKLVVKLSENDFFGSDDFSSALTSLTDATVKNSEIKVVRQDLLSLQDGNATVAVSASRQCGIPAQYEYSGKISDLIAEAASSGQAQSGIITVHGMPQAVQISPVTAYGETVGLLVVQASAARDIVPVMEAAAKNVAAPGIAIALLGVLAIFVVVFLYTRPIALLNKRMNEIAIGRYDMKEVLTGRDEIGDMWRVMQELAVALAIKDYETDNVMKSLYRFVPRDLEKLLGRASMMEVSLGDMTNVASSICIVSVNNLDDVRSVSDDKQFIRFINDQFSMVDRNVTKNGGILLTGDFELSSMKAIFPKTPEAGIRFSLNLFGDAEKLPEEEGKQSELFLLLHTTSFFYGMAGTDERAFPFLSSAEIAFLSTIAAKFRKSGVNIVVTDQYLKTLNAPPVVRYLGFISSGEEHGVFKLYEVLDVYSDLTKRKKISADAKFQEGMRLFYKNDFYLARNAFSAVIKACPDDGVARWYLFACEHYFNKPDANEIRYDLFGIEE
jgi:hypothetical protein